MNKVSKYDMIIKNGKILDGSGNPWFYADLGINEGKISKISRRGLSGVDTNEVINAEGLIVVPGFIDIHNHADFAVLENPRFENMLRQGVTTVTAGQCGSSSYNISEELREKRGYNWKTLSEWRKTINARGISANIAPFFGFGSIRISVLGEEGLGKGSRHIPTHDDLEKMKKMAVQAMEEGAFGMSTGLEYTVQRDAATREVIEITKIVAKYGGVYTTHPRSMGDTLNESAREFIEICEKAGVRGCFSHFKSMGTMNYGKVAECVRLLNEARNKGVDVIFDQYPWNYAAESALMRYLFSFAEEDPQKLLLKLRDPESWAEIKAECIKRTDSAWELSRERQIELEKLQTIAPPPRFMGFIKDIAYIVSSMNSPEFIDMNLQEISWKVGKDIWEVARDIILKDYGETAVAFGPMSEQDVLDGIKCRLTAVSTDSGTIDADPLKLVASHPRNFGTYPKVFETYVRELRAITLEDAVRKMTSLPAQFLGLQDRGLLKEGMYADITIFNPDTIKNKASYVTSAYPEGISYVLVNGKTVISNGEHTGLFPGKVLTRAD